jgi:hypothetical protein
VEHEVCPPEAIDAPVREPPRPARQVGVSEDRDQTTPGRKRPSR